jgi:ubiquitin-conjugating enzyme E2 Q
MPRRAFIADLQKAQGDVLPQGIIGLQQGEDDGQFEFLFASNDIDPVKITALIPDLGEYPKSHEYMIFSGEEAPIHVADALENVRRTNGKTVYELLDIVSATLSRLSHDRDGDTQMPDSQFDDDEQLEDDEDEDVYDSDHEAFQVGPTPTNNTTTGSVSRPVDRKFRARIRADLRMAKEAGFKVGVHGFLLEGTNAFVTVSIRMSKLGISEEAMEAWQVDAQDYLILILQYPNGYKTNEELQAFDSIRLAPNIGFRVCAGKKYKPTLQEAIKAFTVAKKNDHDPSTSSSLPKPEDDVNQSDIKDTFVSKPLNALLQERLVQILRFRGAGMDWKGAEDLYNAQASAGAKNTDVVPDMYFEPEQVNTALPEIVNRDHYSTRATAQLSFPLLSMQFLLRHFVRCTEFCLVCHRKMTTEVEAIKPYVCDSELCLYQYMTLGFGPSIEHEILAQPYVVDLLISFCYNSATARKLKEYPDGLSLTVPPNDPASYNVPDPYPSYRHHAQQNPQPEEIKKPREPAPTFNVGFDCDRLEVIFFNAPEVCPVRRGDWIVMKVEGTLEGSEYHCRVSDVTFFPTISINAPVVLKKNADNTNVNQVANITDKPAAVKLATPAATPKWVNSTFQVYCEDFKSLTKTEKCVAICRLLDTLPGVKALQEYLEKRHPTDLKTWVDRISPAALSLLRWIIASNRACIMQVDGDCNEAGESIKQDRLYGMKDWMQFRFAMGAPDKEQRFITEVRKTANRLNLAHPTLFAWHGSPLHNWHMIIREGLHFKNMDHGRAYGHGVYHALDAGTSTGYSGMNYGYGNNRGTWPHSVLRISTALALNEIVNAPTEFVSNSPFYVVAQLDWIQTRYLLVQCAPTLETIKVGVDKRPQNPLTQDPKRIPRGVSDQIAIPASAIKSSRFAKDERTPEAPKNPGPLKKLKALGSFRKPILIDDDTDSDETDDSDNEVIYGDDPEPPPPLEPQQQVVVAKPKGPPTDFEPGTLDFSKLPLMPMPTYAMTATTKRLMKDLQTVSRVQESTALADLGWLIDVEKIENAYQWIVELHSFHIFDIKGAKLPLVDDMKKRGVKSIVLEMRFNKDYPFTPPYVRVIRPRFLSFNQGGGGHIVLGGAMCMELLTNSGWSSVSSIESVLMQIRMAIASEPFARLDLRTPGDYGTGEAADGYIRACRTHGWEVPPGFKEMAFGSGDASSSRF